MYSRGVSKTFFNQKIWTVKNGYYNHVLEKNIRIGLYISRGIVRSGHQILAWIGEMVRCVCCTKRDLRSSNKSIDSWRVRGGFDAVRDSLLDTLVFHQH